MIYFVFLFLFLLYLMYFYVVAWTEAENYEVFQETTSYFKTNWGVCKTETKKNKKTFTFESVSSFQLVSANSKSMRPSG